MSLSQFGLEPDGRNAHLVPFKNQRGSYDCTLIIDYKGLAALAKRSGQVSYVHADMVCENDQFEFNKGVVVKHEVDFKKDRGKPYAYYAMVRYKDGTEQAAAMTKAEVDRIKARSRAGNSGPWVTDYDEMGKKGLALDTPIATPTGWTTMGEIQVGDIVFDMFGEPVSVIAVSEIKNLQCYRVSFTNGDSIVCDDEHRWVARCGGPNAHRNKFETTTVNEIHDAKIEGMSVTIPVQGVLKLRSANLPIEPYLLGYWLGDGTSKSAAITCSAEDCQHVQEAVKRGGYTLGKLGTDKRTGAKCVRIKGGFLHDLRSIGVLGRKHIPMIYMRSCAADRISILSGLMDSDGHIDKERGRAHFYNTNKALSDGVAELVASLGDVPHGGIRRVQGFGLVCEAHFVGWKPTICPVRLTRKTSSFQPRKINSYRAIANVEMVSSVPTKCIAVEGSTETYLAGKSMAVTHNTVFRRLSKWLELSPEFRDALEADSDTLEELHFENAIPIQRPKVRLLKNQKAHSGSGSETTSGEGDGAANTGDATAPSTDEPNGSQSAAPSSNEPEAKQEPEKPKKKKLEALPKIGPNESAMIQRLADMKASQDDLVLAARALDAIEENQGWDDIGEDRFAVLAHERNWPLVEAELKNLAK
jgi:recombinational DNA repair protein RecT